MKKVLVLTGVLLLLAVVVAACGGQATPTAAPTAKAPAAPKAPAATKAPTAAPQLVGDPIRGGKLYDDWIKETGVEAPKDDQPLWKTQSTNKRAGVDTWRCKECHGWDYKGKDGAYGKGSHMTGFVGVLQTASKTPNEILAALKDSTKPDHNFSTVMNDQALADLALFINKEVKDVAPILALAGNADHGKTLYQDNCINCHGPKALAINFGNDAAPEYPANLANDNPPELLNKLRFGQPAVTDMPSGIDNGWQDQDYADVAVYLKTLPNDSALVEGGRMYDNWIEALAVAAPKGDQPLWKTQTTNTRTGIDTWRCKECHGWDYKGVDGVYGSGSHKTGFKGVFKTASMSADELTAWLNGAKNPDHNFTPAFTKESLARMVAFLQQGLLDKTFIKADKTVVGGDLEHGKKLYNTTCKSCHGEDGKTINFGDDAAPEFFGTIAADNPWEFYNKATVGQPAAAMPAGLELGWTQQDVIDLLTYARTLPTK